MTAHFDESIITGTLLMSGSAAMRLQEARHRRGRVEHRLVHVDVDDLGAGVDLLAGDLDRLLVPVLEDELARTCASR